MAPVEDYFYRYPVKPPQISGRCRVRIYRPKKNVHVVVLTEVKANTGEPISAVVAEIATDLVKRWSLPPKNTKWIEHKPPTGKNADSFDEVKFTWSSSKVASKPKWTRTTLEEAEALTDDVLHEIIDTGVGWDIASLNEKKKNL